MKNWDKQVEMADKEFKLKSDKEMGNLEYLKFKEEMSAKAEIEGNKNFFRNTITTSFHGFENYLHHVSM